MLTQYSMYYEFATLQRAVWGLSLTLIGWIFAYSFYSMFLSPLSHIPGPWLYTISRLPYIWQVLNGRLAIKLHRLHQRYGPVVRTAPNEVSFISLEAWEIIYSNKNSTRREFPKNYDTWNETANKFTTTLFMASYADHRRLRKLLSPAFSNLILKQNESRIQAQISKFQSCIERASEGFTIPIDMNDWFNWLAFDTISDFALGESFNTLENPQHRSWLRDLSKTWHFISLASSLKSLGHFKSFAFALPRKLLQRYVDQLSLVGQAALAKLNIVTMCPTFISIAQSTRRGRDSELSNQISISDDEILSNTELIVTAGTDTSSTVLPATIDLLTRNPSKMSRLVTEIRAFRREDELSILSTANEMPYLTACIMEAMRIFAPVPEGLPRICPCEGQNICGYWIPSGTFCQVSIHAANRSRHNFAEPNKFEPERWLNQGHSFATSTYSKDVKAAFKPFSFGARDCIGQNFGMAIMRLTVAKLLYRFDVECVSQEDWLGRRSYLLWERRPLMVRLKPLQSAYLK